MYDPKFSVKQMYDNYGSSRSTPKTNANKQAADSMRSAGIGGLGGRATTSSAQRIQDSFRDMRESSRTSGGTSVVAQDNNPNRDEFENKSTLQKLKEKAINLFESFGADEPEALIVDNKRVYQGPLFRGYDPTTRIGQFGGEYGKKNYLFGIEKLGVQTYPRTDVSPFLPPSTINMFGVNTDNPRLNTFGINRDSTQPPNMADLSVSPDVPANMDPLTRGLSQAMLPILDEPTAPYTIRDGDTLSEIAEMTGTTVEELAEINNIEKVDEIDAGVVIDIPIRRKPSGLGAKPRPDVTVTELDSTGVATDDDMGLPSTRSDTETIIALEPMFEFISEGEGGYNSSNRGTSGGKIQGSTNNTTRDGKSLTEMTIGEIKTKQAIKDPKNTERLFAVGRFQTIPTTLDMAVDALNLSDDTVFNEDTQNKIGKYLITQKRQRVGMYLEGSSTVSQDRAMLELAKEFASFPVPYDMTVRRNGKDVELKKGDSYYGSGNKAQHTVDEVKDELDKLRGNI